LIKILKILSLKRHAMKLISINENNVRYDELNLIRRLNSPFLVSNEDEIFIYLNYYGIIMEYFEVNKKELKFLKT
jgi:hypothetical protein